MPHGETHPIKGSIVKTCIDVEKGEMYRSLRSLCLKRDRRDPSHRTCEMREDVAFPREFALSGYFLNNLSLGQIPALLPEDQFATLNKIRNNSLYLLGKIHLNTFPL